MSGCENKHEIYETGHRKHKKFQVLDVSLKSEHQGKKTCLATITLAEGHSELVICKGQDCNQLAN